MKATRFWTLPTAQFLSLVTILMLAGSATPQVRAQTANQQASVEQELRDVDQQWLHAATVQDTDFLSMLFDDGMFEVQKGGVVVTGAEMRKTIGIPGRRVQINIDQVQLRGIYGNTAIITDHTTQEGATADGHKVSGEYTVLRVLRKQDGVWRAFAAEMTPLRASTAAKPMIEAVAAEPTGARSSAEEELVGLDHKWAEAAGKGDAKFLKHLLGDRMFAVLPDGRILAAADLLKEIAARKSGQLEVRTDQVRVQGIYGNTAILTDREVRKEAAAAGAESVSQYRVTRVFVRQPDGWRAVAAAMTPIE